MDEYHYVNKQKQILYKSNLIILLAGKNGIVKFSGDAIVCVAWCEIYFGELSFGKNDI